MTRTEHLAWCKERALAYLPHNPEEAITSMLSDMRKHEENAEVVEGPIGMLGMMELMDPNAHSARRYIEGFN